MPARNAGARAAAFVPASAAGEGPSQAALQAARELEVARANRQASAIDALDARWVFACRVASNLEGGRAAILRPQARDRLLGQAARLGLRPFDAHLIIAIVQDSARCGQEPLGLGTAERLPMIRKPHTPTPASLPIAARLGISLAVGALLAALAIRWVLS